MVIVEERMTGRDRIVAVSLLTERELAVVGQTLQRVYHLGEDQTFDDLIDAIDAADRKASGDAGKPAN